MKSVLLIITGSVAAYKSLELIRRLRERDIAVRCIVTRGGEQFVTPLSVASLSELPVYTDIFSLKDETEMGHIRLSREADLIVIAPASADILAKMAAGLADDLASTVLLAADKPILAVPAMNAKMWEHKATQRNVAQLQKDGVKFLMPAKGDLACGEVGAGRMMEADDIAAHIATLLAHKKKLSGLRALVTSGATHEAIDPVRFLGNRSSGKQGHAIAEALAAAGASVTLISGQTALPDPAGMKVVRITSAEEMLAACRKALPADIAVCAAAVADWRVKNVATQKIKKTGKGAPMLTLSENPDILATLSQPGKQRPRLVIGFAAETEKLVENATAKRRKKGCDWMLANDVSSGKGFDAEENEVLWMSSRARESWPRMSKQEIASRLVDKIILHLPSTLQPIRKHHAS